MKIGMMGETQIQHVIAALDEKYDVINLQDAFKSGDNAIIRYLKVIKAALKVDVIYNVFTSKNFWIKNMIFKLMGKKVITHWIGTDVKNAYEGKTDVRKLNVDKHLVCFDELQEELKEVGVQADVLPIIPLKFNFSTCCMPEHHEVLIYMPKGKEEFYGYNILCEVFSKYEDVYFNIVGNDDREKFSAYRNVNVCGYLDLQEMEQLYNKISIVIRCPEHDGLSMFVIEGLVKGKKVIWNHKFPYVLYAQNFDEIVMQLDKVLSSPPSVDFEANQYIREELCKDRFVEKFDKIMEEIC